MTFAISGTPGCQGESTIDYPKLTKNAISLPAIRACIFDMDGLLINSEDIITSSINQLLEKYGRPVLTRSIRVQLMGVPDSTNSDTFHNWAKLPISREQFAREATEQMRLGFPNCKPLPGAEKLLSNLSRARSATSGERIELALASSTSRHNYELKTSTPETKRLLSFFRADRQVLGDDPRVQRRKPAPDIYLVALESLNLEAADSDRKPITPDECLVFEDSLVGVEAGRRAGMKVIWVPHADVAAEYEARQSDVLAGLAEITGVGNDCKVGEMDDGWVERIPSLEHFNYEKYSIELAL